MPAKEYSKVDMTRFVYKAPQKNKKGGMNAYIDESSESPSNPKVQFPKCRCPFGISDKKADASEYARRNLELSADDEGMLKWIQQFDEQNVAVAAKNSEAWFRKKLSAEALSTTLYRHCAQASQKDPDKYAPLVRVKVTETGKNVTNIFIVYTDPKTGEEKYKRGGFDALTKNCHVVPIVDFSGLWFVSKGFGCTLSATDLLVWPSEQEDEFGFVGFSMTKADDVVEEPAAKRMRESSPEEEAGGGGGGESAMDMAAASGFDVVE